MEIEIFPLFSGDFAYVWISQSRFLNRLPNSFIGFWWSCIALGKCRVYKTLGSFARSTPSPSLYCRFWSVLGDAEWFILLTLALFSSWEKTAWGHGPSLCMRACICVQAAVVVAATSHRASPSTGAIVSRVFYSSECCWRWLVVDGGGGGEEVEGAKILWIRDVETTARNRGGWIR